MFADISAEICHGNVLGDVARRGREVAPAPETLPQSHSRICSNACWILRDQRPFARRTMSLTEMCGGIATNMWT